MSSFNIIVMNAYWLTSLCISFTLFFTVVYWFFTLSQEKAKIAGMITALLGSISLTVVLYNIPARLGLFGNLLVPLIWLLPASVIWIKREYFRGLDQRKLVALQIFRVIGAFFLLEMLRGNIPQSFALPAGIGDIFVGMVAAFLFLKYRKIPKNGAIFLIVIGLLDFAVAFFFGFTSLPSPLQLFAFEFNNQSLLFPTGMIPFFLVPYAIVFHILSLINLNEG